MSLPTFTIPDFLESELKTYSKKQLLILRENFTRFLAHDLTIASELSNPVYRAYFVSSKEIDDRFFATLPPLVASKTHWYRIGSGNWLFRATTLEANAFIDWLTNRIGFLT